MLSLGKRRHLVNRQAAQGHVKAVQLGDFASDSLQCSRQVSYRLMFTKLYAGRFGDGSFVPGQAGVAGFPDQFFPHR